MLTDTITVVERIAAFGAELRRIRRIGGGPAALIALVSDNCRGALRAALGAEFAGVHRAAGAAPATGLRRLRLLRAALRAEIARRSRAAGAFPSVPGRSRLRLLRLLCANLIEILRIKAAGVLRHVHSHEADCRAAGVLRCVLHRVRLRPREVCRRHAGVSCTPSPAASP